MDLSVIKAVDREVELRHPATDEGLGMYFYLRSPHSDEVRKAERSWLNKRLAKRKQNLTAESLEAAAEAKIEAAVSGWRFDSSDVTIDGEQPDFSPQTLRSLIRDHVWIRQFLDEELGDFGSFFEA